MLVIAIQPRIEAAILQYLWNHISNLEADYLMFTDWQDLHMIERFLQPFYWATLETQGNQTTVDAILFIMDILIKHFEKSLIHYLNSLNFKLIILTSYRKTSVITPNSLAELLQAGSLLISTIV